MGPRDCAMTSSWSTLGAKDSLCQILSHQNQFSTWCMPWQELAIAGMLNCFFDDLLTMAGLHLLSLAVIRERRKDWCTLLVGHATTALHGEPKSGSQYLFNIYIHAYTLISSTPLFPLPTTFPPTSCCFIFNYYFKFSPEISTTVTHHRTQVFLTLPSFHYFNFLWRLFLGYDLYGCLFPEPNFLWGKSHLLEVHRRGWFLRNKTNKKKSGHERQSLTKSFMCLITAVEQILSSSKLSFSS